MVEIRMNLEVSAQRIVSQILTNNKEIQEIVEAQVKTAIDNLEKTISDPEFAKSLDGQIQISINEVVKEVMREYGIRDLIRSNIKRIVTEKVNKAFEE